MRQTDPHAIMRTFPWKTLTATAALGAVLSPLLLQQEAEQGSAEAAASETDTAGQMVSAGEAAIYLRDPEAVLPSEPPTVESELTWVDSESLPLEDVELTDLRAEPGPWFGRRVRFRFQFNAAREEWEPFFTRFGPEDFVAFEAWGDREYPWEKDVYEHPAGTFFARRGSTVEASLALARPHQRFEAVGVVRDVFLHEPWIEVQSMRRLAEHIPEGTILHVQQARAFLELEQWDMAQDQLRRAMGAPLPLHATRALEEMADAFAGEQGKLDLRRDRTR